MARMSKAFTRESDGEDDDDVALPPLPAGGRNYITPQGYARLRDELRRLEALDLGMIAEPPTARPAPKRSRNKGRKK